MACMRRIPCNGGEERVASASMTSTPSQAPSTVNGLAELQFDDSQNLSDVIANPAVKDAFAQTVATKTQTNKSQVEVSFSIPLRRLQASLRRLQGGVVLAEYTITLDQTQDVSTVSSLNSAMTNDIDSFSNDFSANLAASNDTVAQSASTSVTVVGMQVVTQAPTGSPTASPTTSPPASPTSSPTSSPTAAPTEEPFEEEGNSAPALGV